MAIEAQHGCIYGLHCLATDKWYIGQHKNFLTVETRWSSHIYDSEKSSKLYIHRAINKYGVSGFTAEVLWSGPVKLLNSKEIFYIKKFRSFVDGPKGGGYNLTTGGRQGTGVSEQTRKLLKLLLGSPEARARNSANKRLWFSDPANRQAHLETHTTADAREKASKSAYKRYASVEERAKTSRATMQRYQHKEEHIKTSVAVSKYFAENPVAAELSSRTAKNTWAQYKALGKILGPKGATRTQAQKAQISAAQKKRLADPEVKLRMLEAHRTEACRTSISNGVRKAYENPAARARCSEAAKKAWAIRKEKSAQLSGAI